VVEFRDPHQDLPDFRRCNDIEPLEAALIYARSGFFVVLIEELGKAPHPLIKRGWTSNSTRDPAVITDWYRKYPNANVGISASPEFVILDLDVKDADANGLTAFAGLHEHVLGPTAITPSGGVHRIFRRPEADDRVNRNLSPRNGGFDFMQDRRRQILVAPSVVTDSAGETRKYRWTQGGQPAPMPKAAINRMYELSGRISDTENDPQYAPETPELGEPIEHHIELDTDDRSHGAFALARNLYQHHGHRSDADILATVWAVDAFQEAARDRRDTTESAIHWLWKYAVWPAAKSRFVPPTWDGYDPRSPVTKAMQEGRDLAPWEVPPEGDVSSVFDKIRPLHELVAAYNEPPEFVVPYYLPKGVLTTLFGKDGTGKTMFMQRVCTLLAAGRPILGRPGGRRCKCLMVLTEDTMPAIIDRQKRIRSESGIDFHDVRDTLFIPENLMMADVKMVTFDRELRAANSPFFKALIEYVERAEPELVVLDPISDIYADEENRREKVSQFLRAMNALAVEFNIAVVLLGHPAKAADSEYSGSGAWSSKSRSRLFMEAASDVPNSPVTLMHRKASYGKRAEDLTLVWQEGVLKDLTPVEKEEYEEEMKTQLIEMIVDFVKRGIENGEVFTDTPQSGDRFLPRAMELRDMAGLYDAETIRKHLSVCFQAGLLIPQVVFDGKQGRPEFKDRARRPRAGIYYPTPARSSPPTVPKDPRTPNEYGITEEESKTWPTTPDW